MRQKHHPWIKTDPKTLAEKLQSPEHRGIRAEMGGGWVRRREGSAVEAPQKGLAAVGELTVGRMRLPLIMGII